MPRTSLVIAVPLAAVALTAAGCGGSSHSSSPSTLIPSSGTLPNSGSVATLPVTSTTAGGSLPAAGSAVTSGGGSVPSSSPTVSGTTGAGTGTGTGTQTSTAVTVPGSGSYTVTAAAHKGTGPCVTPGLPTKGVPFTVSVTNRGTTTEPVARVAVGITDPDAGSIRPVAEFYYYGFCTGFSEPDGTLAPGQTTTFDGTANGVSSAAVLDVRVISTPASDTLAMFSVPLG